jgi:hypothetical protein
MKDKKKGGSLNRASIKTVKVFALSTPYAVERLAALNLFLLSRLALK